MTPTCEAVIRYFNGEHGAIEGMRRDVFGKAEQRCRKAGWLADSDSWPYTAVTNAGRSAIGVVVHHVSAICVHVKPGDQLSGRWAIVTCDACRRSAGSAERHGTCGTCFGGVHEYPAGWQHVIAPLSCARLVPTNIR
jgi:hypothetical protein